ncbi:DUF1471 domain-containing protein [Pantoea stewartii]|uniref:DUF1471 domain-containing protein n=1 Tax=Pantoea stewartii TaxID=66269 RepID=UPI00197F7237|nr:DUF1471 domain-containing protein [Pantoea stewartii]
MLMISVLSFNSLASTEVQSAEKYIVIGHVFISGKTTSDEVISGLKKKAEEENAPYYKITAIGGNNELYGSAVLLK